MMKRIPLLLLLCFAYLNGFAQLPDFELKSGYNDKKQLVLKAEKRIPGTLYLQITFRELNNTILSSKVYRTPVRSSCVVLTLDPINKEKYATANYSYRYWHGNPECNPDTTFVYRLPYSEDVSRKVYSLSLIGGKKVSRSAVNWHSVQFRMQAGDIAYAARKGTVVDIKKANPDENVSSESDGRITYIRNVNEINVEHTDGTYATYSVLDSVFVKVGQQVYPHTPIGTAGSYNGEEYQIRLSVYYCRLDSVLFDKAPIQQHFFSPVFATTEGEKKLTMRNAYQPDVNEKLITREMTKREIKKLKEK